MDIRRVRAATLLSIAASVLFVAACADDSPPTSPDLGEPDAIRTDGTQLARADLERAFRRASPVVLALPQAVFADHDEERGRLVFGVEAAGAARGVEAALKRLGIPASAYEVRVVEPIEFMATLRGEHRPTMGGIQIHFGNYLCTLGFNVDHAGGRSFITNSHCTDHQGGTEGTTYYQPVSSVNSTPIAIEAADPEYFSDGECPQGKKCRYSDASRALYQTGIDSDGTIGKTTGANNGSIELAGVFDVASQDDSSTEFSGTVNKVGRTTGWTRGAVSGTCVDVAVSRSNIALLCQTLVNAGVGAGDSGSPVFRQTGSNSAELIGILWGGNSSGTLFVFSPLSGIVAELGALNATTDGTGGGGGGGGGGGEEPNCPPRSNKPACR